MCEGIWVKLTPQLQALLPPHRTLVGFRGCTNCSFHCSTVFTGRVRSSSVLYSLTQGALSDGFFTMTNTVATLTINGILVHCGCRQIALYVVFQHRELNTPDYITYSRHEETTAFVEVPTQGYIIEFHVCITSLTEAGRPTILQIPVCFARRHSHIHTQTKQPIMTYR